MEKYKALFTTPTASIVTEVLYIDDFDYAFKVHGVTIYIDAFESLLIYGDHYSEAQLKLFSYQGKTMKYADGSFRKHLSLTHTQLQVEIPIQVINVETKAREEVIFHVKMSSDQKGDVHNLYEVLSATSDGDYIDYALNDIAAQLKDSYQIVMCGCCKNCETNPFGGSPFFNQLCFKKAKEAFWELEETSKDIIYPFIRKGLTEPMYIHESCEEYVSRF